MWPAPRVASPEHGAARRRSVRRLRGGPVRAALANNHRAHCPFSPSHEPKPVPANTSVIAASPSRTPCAHAGCCTAREGAVMVQRTDVELPVEGDVTLRGWLFVPDGPGPHPAITMAHGFAGVKEHGLERFAQVFAAAGFVVLVHDHRGFGASDGSPRFDIDPWAQIADWRRAISFLESQPFVDPDRIGLWGSSYAGGHAIVLGATDRRRRAGGAPGHPSSCERRPLGARRLSRARRYRVL